MSRIGQQPIEIPGGVQVEVKGQHVKVKGPKGELERDIPAPITPEVEGNQLVVKRPSDLPQHKALHGLSRSLLANMVEGVTKGFTKALELHGKEFRAEVKGKNLVLNLGFSHDVVIEPPEGISFEVQGQNPIIIRVRGIDKELVGQVTATIRDWKKPEPYKGKGLRYVGEQVRRKAGKAGVA